MARFPFAVLVVGGGGEEGVGGVVVEVVVVVVEVGGLAGVVDDEEVDGVEVVSVEDLDPGTAPGSNRGMYMLYTNEPAKKVSEEGEIGRKTVEKTNVGGEIVMRGREMQRNEEEKRTAAKEMKKKEMKRSMGEKETGKIEIYLVRSQE
jgi:hypothetical protein